jgi:RHS repeat-associated protein
MSGLAQASCRLTRVRDANFRPASGRPRNRTKYSYDAAGHVTAYGTNSFTYNNRGRMEAAAADSTDYLYNALGEMYEKSGTLGTTLLMQDEAGHLIGEYSGSGSLIEETIWLGDIPVATLQPNGSGGVIIYYVHTDHLNSPRKIAQSTTGTLAWRWDADPFGTTAPNQNPAGLGAFVYNLRAPGQYYQAESGLNQNVFRDYDPLTGRYVEPDPLLQPNRFLQDELAFYVPILIKSPRWLHPYTYVRSQPEADVDPLGLGPWGVLKCIWMFRTLDKYNQQCRGECPNDTLGQIKFMETYKSGFLSDALLKCTCSKAEAAGDGELCAKWLATCISAGVSGPPRP